MLAAASLTTRGLASCLRSSHLQLRRGLAIEPWFPEALEAHAKVEGTTFVASGARSATGQPLGRVAARYRSEYLKLDLPTLDFEELESIDFAWCKNEWQYERVVVPALLKYKELHGNMEVPVRFVVPSSDDDWPEEEMWGMQLGRTVDRIRSSGTFVRDDADRRQWLEEEGFVFDVREQQWERAKLALLKYKELHGNMDVPFRFVVPLSDSDWPEKMWGMQLGSTVSMIRSSGIFVRDDANRRQWLEDEGFVFDVHEQQWERAKLALLKYKELHGNMEVPQSFMVPSSDDDWPEKMWGMQLGSTVDRIRSSGYFVRDDADRRQWLEEEGFRLETAPHEQPVHNAKWENVVAPALLKYKELHGNMEVPVRFVVPSSDDDWPEEEMWGMQLGRTVSHIRSSGIFVRDDADRRQWLEDEGFVFDVHEQQWERAKLALLKYKELHGNMEVPFRFVVPSSDDDWPEEEMWGMQLGSTVNRIRSAGYFVRDDADRRQWLEDEGFVFDVHEQQWESATLALLKYKELHGNMDVPKRFVVPSSDSDWPEEEMWGMQLGSTVAMIRSKGTFVRDDDDRRRWLEDEGFVWKLKASRVEKVRAAAKYYGRERRGAVAR